jgi:hypothetical protein
VKKNFIYILIGINILLLIPSIACIFLGFKDKDLYKSLEAEEITIRKAGSKAIISLKINKDMPEISINDENGKSKIYFNSSGLYLKNKDDKIIGSFTTLADGGGGFGLADREGMASSIIRGGDNPSLALFGNKPDPIAAFGIVQNVPHLIVSAENGSEGILLHGGERSGMMVLDETGQLKIFICKDGIYQGKQETMHKETPKKEKYFSHKEDKELLFPDGKNKNFR